MRSSRSGCWRWLQRALLKLPTTVFCALFAETVGVVFFGVGLYAGWTWFFYAGTGMLAVGICLHLWAYVETLRLFHGVYDVDPWELGRAHGTRIARMMRSPAWCRWELFSLRLFGDRTHKSLDQTPQVHLSAVDLNRGEQFIFSNRFGVVLDSVGCRHLWEQLPSRYDLVDSAVDIGNMGIGYSVAASSAFPPVFSPMPMSIDGQQIGVFWDGGLIDNHAVESIRALTFQTSPERQRYDPRLPHSHQGFSAVITQVIVMDGSGAHTVHERSGWSRFRGFIRILSVFLNKQKAAAVETAWHLQKDIGIPCSVIGLAAGLVPGSDIFDEGMSNSLAKVRTHFDRFSRGELAVLIYAGYTWVEYLNANEMLTGEPITVPTKSFQEILPAPYRPDLATTDELKRHMGASGVPLGVLRDWKRRGSNPDVTKKGRVLMR